MSVKPDSNPQVDVGRIIADAAAHQQSDVPARPSPEVAALAERLDLLVADFGKWSEYKAASADYITEFAAEIRWHRAIRLAVSIACGLVLLGLSALLVAVLCWSRAIFGNDPGHALTAVIVASIGGIVVIAIAALRSAFSNVKDRNEGLPMPEHVKQVVEVGQSLFGKG
jgi:hypothetical protein